MTTTVGFVGLGAMGAPMAGRLATHGFIVNGYDPVTAPPSGVAVRRSAAAAAEDADIVCVMVATPAQASSAVTAPDGVIHGLRLGAVVILMATVGPEAAAGLAEAVSATGGSLVDAPVSGGVARAGTGDLLIMATADDRAWATSASLLGVLGSNVFRLGERIGDAQRMKLVNQLLCGVHIAAAAEALAFAADLGIDPATAHAVVSTGAASSFMLDDRGPRMVAGAFETPKSAVDIFVKDLGLVTQAGSMPLPIATAALERFETASHAGNGRLDDSAVITTYSPCGQEHS